MWRGADRQVQRGIENRRLAELLSGCVQRGKPALSSALPGRPRICRRLGKAIACIQISTAGSWWLWTTAEALLFFRFSHQTHFCGKSLFRTKWKCFGFKNETRNGEMAGVQSWPKCWLSGSYPSAHGMSCQRWWTMNICHSVVSCLIFKTKVSLERRCFQQCLELENLIKYDAGWYIFFVAMNTSFTCQLYRRRIGGQLTLV